jgi:signal transduction histidine kinase
MISIAVSLFAFGGALMLLLRFREWRFGFLAAMTAFLTAVLAVYLILNFLAEPMGWSFPLAEQSSDIAAVIISVMALAAVFLLERMLRERRQAQAQISSAMEQAALADRTKAEFMANMSHELRTPLNAIMGFSETMRMEMFGPLGHGHYREYVAHIHERAAHLAALIDDILEVSKLDAGTLQLVEQEVDIADVVRVAEQIAAERAAAAGVTVEVAVPADFPKLHADRRAVGQILTNLLSNAIKFTPAGGRATVHAELAPGGSIVLRVSDNGIGIAKDDIDKALAEFTQADGRLSRKYEGTGLGLPLCERLAKLHGGFLRLESKPGAGTTVTVEFPAERSIAQPAGPRQSQTAPSAAPPIPPKPGKRRATRSADPIATAVRASGA